MSKAEKLAEQYADKILALYDEELAKQNCPRYLKMKVHYCSCDDVEEAYLQGYQQAREEIYKELFRMSLSSNAMDYVKGVANLMDKIKEE